MLLTDPSYNQPELLDDVIHPGALSTLTSTFNVNVKWVKEEKSDTVPGYFGQFFLKLRALLGPLLQKNILPVNYAMW